MEANQLIALLNSMSFGDLGTLHEKIEEARRGCLNLRQDELAERLQEAGSALTEGDTGTYRKRLETVIAKLGHLK